MATTPFFASPLFSEEFIFINTLPKSGSCFLVSCMGENLGPLGYSFVRISEDRFSKDDVNEKSLQAYSNHRYFSQEHIDASEENIKLLSQYLSKFILHLRDPRQALVSWYHHVERDKDCDRWSDDIRPPQGYHRWSMKRKLDWQIEHYLPACISWIEEWCEVIDSSDLEILVTTFEEMVLDIPAFLKKIFKFYDFDLPSIQFPPFETGELNQRKGLVDEWKEVFDVKQKIRISEVVPVSLLERFGWDLDPGI